MRVMDKHKGDDGVTWEERGREADVGERERVDNEMKGCDEVDEVEVV
jgi:hypothetical protein